ncbi:glycerophosphodiester phosphodiesterase [Segetibacter sp. 3557_3]|uniref:glycerophosphodiester phosphodiesterase n=1 Tax=Segetibacter sp. 3557_3 TaxID=2547429 RepID=UPI0014047970|nr:glycerophosphodiester phosphodiesterase family protein [Segetibacter sp. 3557_3]
MRILLTYFVLFVCIPLASMSQVNRNTPAAMVPGVTAHRGYSMAYPENTLKAFQAGIDARADWVELDIHKSKDGQIVVSHDKNTKRASEIDLEIANTTYAELLKVDVATEFRNKNKLTIQECPPERMPLLSEALKLMLRQSKVRLSIQPKMDCVAEAIAIVRKLNAEKIVGFNDASLPLMSKVKTLAPSIPVFWDRPATADIDADITIAKERGFERMVLHFSTITTEKINKIKSAGIQVGAWTVDDPKMMGQLLRMGIERIYTNDPKLLIKVKNEGI